MDEDSQVTQDVDFLEEMENLLNQHDYERPREGDIRRAVIAAISPQGVIVDLGLKRDGVVPASELMKLDAAEREEMAVGDEVDVYITSTSDPESLQVSLHMARLNEDWLKAEQLLESGEILETRIINHNRGGALVPFGRLRGFIPSSHLSFISQGLGEQQRQERMASSHGRLIPAKVIEVDRERRRLVLSNREAERIRQETKRAELLENLQEGDVLTGRVTGWRDFGAFVDLGGADGLIHISELAWHRVNHPREVLQMGTEVEVSVLKVDNKRGRISLSRKLLLPNPWSTIEERYAVGHLVEGRVIRVVDYGAFVEVEPGVEGLLHSSQISPGTIDNPGDVLREGEVHLLRIISIDGDRQRIGLSLKAVTAFEQIDWMARRESERAAGDSLIVASDEDVATDQVIEEQILATASAFEGEHVEKPDAGGLPVA